MSYSYAGNPVLDIQRYLDDLDSTEKRLQAWQEDPEGMALMRNVAYFQNKAVMFYARGDYDKALYYEELVEERLELLEEGEE